MFYFDAHLFKHRGIKPYLIVYLKIFGLLCLFKMWISNFKLNVDSLPEQARFLLNRFFSWNRLIYWIRFVFRRYLFYMYVWLRFLISLKLSMQMLGKYLETGVTTPLSLPAHNPWSYPHIKYCLTSVIKALPLNT